MSSVALVVKIQGCPITHEKEKGQKRRHGVKEGATNHNPNLTLERTTDLAGALRRCRQMSLERIQAILQTLEDERETLHLGCSEQFMLPRHSEGKSKQKPVQ